MRPDECLITVITPTIGRSGLDRLIDTIARQSICKQVYHLLLWDDARAPDANEPKTYDSDLRFSLVTPPGTARYVDSPSGPLLAIGMTAARTPWVTFADDDVWWEDDHLEKLMSAVADRNWASTLRKIWTPTGEFLGVDRFESVGDDPGRTVPYEMCDSNVMLFRRELGVRAAHLARETPRYDADRLLYGFFKEHGGPRARTNHPTVNHICPPRLVDFFSRNCSH